MKRREFMTLLGGVDESSNEAEQLIAGSHSETGFGTAQPPFT
jgi:hypothetical protein